MARVVYRNRSRKSSDLQSSSEFGSASYESTIRWSSVEQLSRCVRKQLGCEDPWRIGGGRCGGSSKRIKKYGLGMLVVFRCILKILAFSKVSGFRDVYHFRLSGESSQSVRSEIPSSIHLTSDKLVWCIIWKGYTFTTALFFRLRLQNSRFVGNELQSPTCVQQTLTLKNSGIW